MKKAAALPATTPRDTWEQIDSKEWRRRLQDAREFAVRRLARFGLNGDEDDPETPSVVALILETPLGAALVPTLGDAQTIVEANVRTIGDPMVPTSDPTRSREHLSDQVFNYAVAAVDAAFLFGVIAGTATSWGIVEAMDPPTAPPARKRGSK